MKKTKLSKVLALTLVFAMVMSSAAFGAIIPGTKISNTLNATITVAPVATTANIVSLAELKEALLNNVIKTINITKNFETAEKIVVNRPVTINGGNNTITFTGDSDGWQGNYVLQVYKTEGVTISDVKLTGGDAGLLVNGSKVTLTGIINISGNKFGGIESSMGSEVTTSPSLTVTGATFVNEFEAYGLPTIWEDKVTGTVMMTTSQFTINNSVKTNQVQYYLNSANAVDPNANIANVSTLEELKTALLNANKNTININAEISNISERLVINRSLTINGKLHKITFTDAINGLTEGAQHGILVGANNVTINDLNVQMSSKTLWQGVYGIQVYKVTGVELNDVTVSGADGGIIVNGSEVNLTGTTTLSGNEFGGIEVSKGVDVENNPLLTVAGSLVNVDEAIGLPTIWEDGVAGNVAVSTENTLQLTKIGINGQQQYYLKSENAIPVILSGLNSAINATVGQENTVQVTATLANRVKSVENSAIVLEVSKDSILTTDVVITDAAGKSITAVANGNILKFTMGSTTMSIDTITNLKLKFNTEGIYNFNIYLQQQ